MRPRQKAPSMPIEALERTSLGPMAQSDRLRARARRATPIKRGRAPGRSPSKRWMPVWAARTLSWMAVVVHPERSVEDARVPQFVLVCRVLAQLAVLLPPVEIEGGGVGTPDCAHRPYVNDRVTRGKHEMENGRGHRPRHTMQLEEQFDPHPLIGRWVERLLRDPLYVVPARRVLPDELAQRPATVFPGRNRLKCVQLATG